MSRRKKTKGWQYTPGTAPHKGHKVSLFVSFRLPDAQGLMTRQVCSPLFRVGNDEHVRWLSLFDHSQYEGRTPSRAHRAKDKILTVQLW
jgi:hypothetical protein